MRWILTILCLAVFAAGLYCFGLAFHEDQGAGSLLLFLAGIGLSCLAFFLPWQVFGHSRK
ncbi:hypothetical protein [Gulosibacter hominis]|uniref:hypothetical protein n=1 Tax=Gulosibacter hominis TaxID=2770504 RepID=UPI00191B536E|nr:hypothetical protein [Gulosibacter hominis]